MSASYYVEFEEESLTITVPGVGRLQIITLLGDSLMLSRLPLEGNDKPVHQETLKKEDFLSTKYWEDIFVGYCKKFLALLKMADRAGKFYLEDVDPRILAHNFLKYSAPSRKALASHGHCPAGSWCDAMPPYRVDHEEAAQLGADAYSFLRKWAEAREVDHSDTLKEIRQWTQKAYKERTGEWVE